MGWQAGEFHTTTVLDTSATANSDGTYNLTVFDNDDRDSAGNSFIGIHTANLDRSTIPSTITIYRLSPDHLYLIQGSDQAQTLVGNMFNDEIVGGSGNDIIIPGSGSYNVLTGGGGSDVLRLNRVSATAVDTITDYDQGNNGTQE
jgi:Ca2+-binding RTX toxin-like protein